VVLVAAIAGLICANPASAQNITKVYGDGQLLICTGCIAFTEMEVRVTDSNGNGLPNVTVNWAVTGGGYGGALLLGATTTTAPDGTAYNTFSYLGVPPTGSPFVQYVQNTVQASTSNATVTFTLSQSLYDQTNSGLQAVYVLPGTFVQALIDGQPLSGQAGTTGSTPIQVSVTASRGGGIANVSLQLVDYLNQNPIVNCAEADGGEVNTALTNANGLATCTPVFSGVPGTGLFYVLVGAGGVPPPDPTVPPFSNWTIGPMNLTVTAAQPGYIEVIQGNGQSAAPGQTLPSPLQVEVATASGTAVAGQSVNWTVTPAGAVNLSSTSGSTDATGRTSVNATFATTASGIVQITATCPACPTTARSVTFSVTAVPIVTISGMTIVSGNNQSALANAVFPLPLVVQVNASNGQPDTSANVQFTVTGPASLSSSSVATNSSGQAQVSVQAGATAGPVTVTASVGSFTQTFSLTVNPPGPTLTASSFYNGADFQAGSISPCGIATIIAPGLAPGIQGVVTSGNVFGPLPYLLASDAVSFNGTSAPIFNVANVNGQQQITVQVPCEVVPAAAVPVTVNVGSGSSTVNVPVLAASPGIFQTTMSDGVSRAVIVRPDGSFVSLANPARRGEVVQAFATGLGVTSPSVGTNATAISGSPAIVQGTVIVGITNNASQGEGVRVTAAQVAPDLIGVFSVPFQVPTDAATGNNVSFSIGLIPVGGSTPFYSATAKIPID
jgi:uncharacterized protein (TIGR03437 family)